MLIYICQEFAVVFLSGIFTCSGRDSLLLLHKKLSLFPSTLSFLERDSIHHRSAHLCPYIGLLLELEKA